MPDMHPAVVALKNAREDWLKEPKRNGPKHEREVIEAQVKALDEAIVILEGHFHG